MTEHITIRGGAGGTAAALEHLRHAARVLLRAADLLDDAATSARWAEREGLGPAPSSVVTHARAHAALAPLIRGTDALDEHAAEARRLSAALAHAADAYDRAEDAAGRAMRATLAVVGHYAGERPVAWGLVSVVLARAALPGLLLAAFGLHATGRGPEVADRLAATDPAEHAVQLLAGFVRALAPGTSLPDAEPVVGAAGLLTTATALAGLAVPSLARRPLRVTARVGASSSGGTPPREMTDLLARIRELYPSSGGTPGTVGVDRLDHPDGTRSWVVTIPGTQEEMSFGASSNPMDMGTNVDLIAGAPDDGTLLVAQALAQAGARPGEPVLLAGHSQGGLVAMAVARNPAFTARHPVPAVVTAGSPVATLSVPRGTATLHLEHRQDLVPAADGSPNPDAPNRTTAVRDLRESPLPADRIAARSAGAAHGVEAYTRTAAAVTAAGGASVRAWEKAAATVLGGPGAVMHRFEFTGERGPVRETSQVLAPGADRIGQAAAGRVVASGPTDGRGSVTRSPAPSASATVAIAPDKSQARGSGGESSRTPVVPAAPGRPGAHGTPAAHVTLSPSGSPR